MFESWLTNLWLAVMTIVMSLRALHAWRQFGIDMVTVYGLAYIAGIVPVLLKIGGEPVLSILLSCVMLGIAGVVGALIAERIVITFATR